MVASQTVTDICDATEKTNFEIRKSKSCNDILLDTSTYELLHENLNIASVFHDMQEDLLHETETTIFRICKCPSLQAKLQDLPVNVLIDTGSEVTCISEEFYLANEKIFSKCAKLGVSGKSLRVAIGNKTTKIKSQILLKISIGSHTDDIIF